MTPKQIIKAHFSKLGAKGGAKSRRTLTTEQAKAMVAARIAKRDAGKASNLREH